MAADDELEPRVNALENDVRHLKGRIQGSERDAAAARILAGAADRDVSEFRTGMNELRGEVTNLRGEMRGFRTATTASFNAQRQDFVDLRNHVDQGFTEMRQGFAEMRGKFDGTAAGLQQTTQMLQTVIDDQP